VPLAFCCAGDYLTPRLLPRLSKTEEKAVPFTPLGVDPEGGHFGTCRPALVWRAEEGYVGTEVVVFPWNQFFLDGQPVPEDHLRAWLTGALSPWDGALRTAVLVPAGAHVLEHRFVPPPAWRRLHRCSTAVLLGWVAVLAGWTAADRLRKRLAARGRSRPLLAGQVDPLPQQARVA
jgi:hypothetical protein